tara:strand:+ start:848 stop:1936 length:1089 start_codon:yes stop_codon:yes gene_type:complete
MYFGLSEEQAFFQDNVKKFLEDQASLDVIRRIAAGEGDDLQKEIHQGLINLGLNSLLIPEEYGGLELDLLFAAAVSEGLGAGIAPIPFIGSYVMAPLAIMHGGNDAQKENYLNKISANQVRFGVGLTEYIAAREDAGVEITGNKVNGRALFAIDGDNATHFILADSEGAMCIIDVSDPGIKIVKLTAVDKTRGYFEIVLKDVNAEILENSVNNKDPITKTIDAGRIMLAADSIGASQVMIDKSVEYAKERKQFGRVIGSFQAVKHMCAEMAAELEPCYAMVWHAAHCFSNVPEEARLMACQSKSHVSEVGKMVSKKATEVHGGMGFTDLLGLHYWFKRIGMNRQLLGSPEIVREEAGRIQGF